MKLGLNRFSTGVQPSLVDIDFLSYLTRAGNLSSSTINFLSTFISGLKADMDIASLSDVFDGLYVIANETETAAQKNLVTDASHLSLSAVPPSFNPFTGYTGNGTSSYLLSNLILSSASKYKQDNAHMAVYSRTNRTSAAVYNCLIGVAGSPGTALTRIIPIGADGNSRMGINHSGTDSFVANPSNEQGLSLLSRSSSANFQWYRNGSLYQNRSVSSVATPAVAPTILAYNVAGDISLFAASEVSFVSIGRALSAIEVNYLFIRLEAYLDAMGAGVV